MNNEKVVNISTEEINTIYRELNTKGIKDLSEKLAYVKENKDGITFLYFMFKEFDDKMLNNYGKIPNEYVFSKAAVDGLLRSYLFVLQYMKDSLPQHAYEHIQNKSNSFLYQLDQQLKFMK